jgi:hypothetical protein
VLWRKLEKKAKVYKCSRIETLRTSL